MTENRRIFWNIVATYGRSLYGLVVGILCGRWTLQALGHTDYGLFGLIGGIVGFISFFNGILSVSLGRYYALSVGEERADAAAGLESCRMWFTTGVIIHTILPLTLMIVGYPIGEWAVRNFLNIPSDRVWHCVWIWRFVCITTLISMMTVPINAFYGAKQYIAELTLYSFIASNLTLLFQYYMITHPGIWLVKYALWSMLIGLLPGFFITIRAFYIFPECRFRVKYMRCWENIKKLGSYAFWNAWGTLGAMLRGQGVAIVINKYFGAKVNAGMAVGNSLSGHSETLSGSMMGALSPAIYNAWGAGDHERARMLSYKVCKIAPLLIMIFAVPMALEVENLLKLWLKNPPPYAAGYCLFAMIWAFVDKMGWGFTILINAKGKIALFQMVVGTVVVLTFPLAWLFASLGWGVYSPGIAALITIVLTVVGRVVFGRRLVGISARYWLYRITIPLFVVVGLALLIGCLPRLFMANSYWRIPVTTAMVEVFLLPLSWFFILDRSEREFVSGKVELQFAIMKGIIGKGK